MAEIPAVHGNIHSGWERLAKRNGGTEIELAVRTSEREGNHGAREHDRFSFEFRSIG
jgi:hypothetical protein